MTMTTAASDESAALEETETSSTMLQGGGLRQVTPRFGPVPAVFLLSVHPVAPLGFRLTLRLPSFMSLLFRNRGWPDLDAELGPLSGSVRAAEVAAVESHALPSASAAHFLFQA